RGYLPESNPTWKDRKTRVAPQSARQGEDCFRSTAFSQPLPILPAFPLSGTGGFLLRSSKAERWRVLARTSLRDRYHPTSFSKIHVRPDARSFISTANENENPTIIHSGIKRSR